MFSTLPPTIGILVLQCDFNFDLLKYQRDKIVIRQQMIYFSTMRIIYLAIRSFFH